MTHLEIFGIAVALAMDAASVAAAISASLGRCRIGQILRLSFHFGLFQAAMPIAGWYLGRAFYTAIAGFDHWIAFALLALIGGKMIRDYFDGKHSSSAMRDPTRGASLLVLSIATSIDALVVGAGLAFLDVRIWYPAAVIGAEFGKRMVLAGGVVLIAIGVKIVYDHTAPV